MKFMSHRIGKLETRTCGENLTNEKPYTNMEIVKWYVEDKKEYCITIAYFEKNDEGFYLKSVGDRIVLGEFQWKHLGILIETSFKHLNEFVKQGLGEKDD